MIDPLGNVEVGDVGVYTTHNRGHSAEELTEMALEKIIYVSANMPDVIKSQALAYKDHLRGVLLFYMRQAMLSERVTMRGEIAAEMKETN
tara:strand:+ start:3652 stop:3921 length:270 start_codon:yes stop_codon:yes gene_type:complete